MLKDCYLIMTVLYLLFTLKKLTLALTNVDQLVGHWPAKQMVTGLIPSQGTCLG